MNATAASAPGKVLLAGGYLVVDRAHTGLVFGLSSRIHVVIEDLTQRSVAEKHEIVVRSPQFQDAEWRYEHNLLEDGGGVKISQRQDQSLGILSRNKFVETTLAYALTYVAELVPYANLGSLAITILADDDYYSQSQTSTKCPRNQDSPFNGFNVPLNDAHKTGLGSSAALVTALTAALFKHYQSTSKDGQKSITTTEKQSIHNLAQTAHCTAQGKIGSGFDVAAAVYGSCVYRRFQPSVLELIGSLGSEDFSGRLREVVDGDGTEATWDTQISKSAVDMPKGLRLVMCDVDCGSETPGMVKKVFAWKKEKPKEALQIWEALQRANEDLATELQRLSETAEGSFEKLKNIIQSVRSLIREMSEKAEVPIEPKEQTDLLDACSRVPGVVGGVVPGAGGYDALALIVEDKDETLNKLSQMLASYEATNPGSGGVRIGTVRLLGVKQEMEGLKNESLEKYRGWLQIDQTRDVN